MMSGAFEDTIQERLKLFNDPLFTTMTYIWKDKVKCADNILLSGIFFLAESLLNLLSTPDTVGRHSKFAER